MKKNLLSEYNN